MIVDEISIIKLEILSNKRKQLVKACDLLNFNTTVFRDLSIIIVIEDFN